MEEKIINGIFDLLDEWRGYSAYQLERRADIYFAFYIKEILNGKKRCEIDFVLPEFPVMKGILDDSDDVKSFRIDYLAYSKASGKVFLVELKTDINSKYSYQEEYLHKAKEKNINKLVGGLLKIYDATKSKEKYKRYLKKLSEIGWIKFDNSGKPINTSGDYEVEVIYILPNNSNDDANVISFDDIRDYLKDNKDFITQRFLKSLKAWEVNPNISD